MEKTCGCSCCGAPSLIFPCSGAADVGEVADRAARTLTRHGVGKMYCLAGVGGHVNNILVTTQAAKTIVAIDGCALDCARKTLEHAGFSVSHVRVTDLGLEKGSSPANDDNVAIVTRAVIKILEK